MSSRIYGIFIGMIFFPITIVQAADTRQPIPEDVEIKKVYQGSIDIRALAAPDIRNVKGLASNTKEHIVDLNKAMDDLNAQVREKEIFIQLSTDLLFDFDKSAIKPEAANELAKLAKVITGKSQGPVTIQGHTDSKGPDSYNQKLSLRRAKAIQSWLTEKGRIEAEFRIEGYGATRPVAANTTPAGRDNPEGRAKNRRVEVLIQSHQNE